MFHMMKKMKQNKWEQSGIKVRWYIEPKNKYKVQMMGRWGLE